MEAGSPTPPPPKRHNSRAELLSAALTEERNNFGKIRVSQDHFMHCHECKILTESSRPQTSSPPDPICRLAAKPTHAELLSAALTVGESQFWQS